MSTKVLIPEDVQDIYERCLAGESGTSIARDYAISQATVSGIKLGYYWNDVTGLPRVRPLSRDQERSLGIYKAYWEEKLPVSVIAERFGVSTKTVHDTRVGKVRPHITGHPIWKKDDE